MARRKSKARRKEDAIQGIVGFVLLGTFYLSFQATQSINAAMITTAIVFAIGVGVIIYIIMDRNEKLKRSGIAQIDTMDGFLFEKYLGHLFRAHGYEVVVTKAAGDFGADLVIKKDGQKTVVQAKRYSSNVGIKAVQEAQAAIAHYGASSAWVVSNRYYTQAAEELARSNRVRLVNRDELITMILQMKDGKVKPKSTAAQAPTLHVVPSVVAGQAEEPVDGSVCPRCGSKMVLRKGPRGEFYGCSSFPKCRMTKAI